MVPYGGIEFMEYMAACIRSAGWDVEVDLHAGSLRAAPAQEQEPYFRQTMAACEQATVDTGLVRELAPPSESELAAWYQAYLLTYACLVGNGYPASSPPSEDAYIASGGGNWHPYELLTTTEGVAEVCPQDLLVLWEMMASGNAP